MEEITMEDSKDSDKAFVKVVPGTPVKPQQSLRFYVRRNLNKPQDIDGATAISPQGINDPEASSSSGSNMKEELEGNCFFPGDCGFVIMKESDESKTTQGSKSSKSSVTDDDSQGVHLKEESKNSKEEVQENFAESELPKGKKKKNSKVTPKKQRFHRPRIMEDGKKPKKPATTPLRTTISKKRKKKEKVTEEEVVVEPVTPEKQSLPKRRKTEKTKTNVARTLNFDQETSLSCLELSRNLGPNFPLGRKRMARRRKSIWKTKSKRSNRKKNAFTWAGIVLPLERVEKTLLSDGLSSQADIEAPKLDFVVPHHQKDNDISSSKAPKRRSKKIKDIDLSSAVPKRHNKKSKHILEHLIQHMSYQKYHGLSSLAEVPLHIEDTVMRSDSCVVPKGPIKRTMYIAKLVKEMSGLKISEMVTTLIKSSKKKNDMQIVTPKVSLDPETVKEWELLMVNDHPDRPYADEETESKWKREREMFQSRIDLFINRMHLLQGNRKFKQWKGSVVDSVVGVFLTQNVSDYLSSNAFISVAAKFPLDATGLNGPAYYVEEPLEVNDLGADDKGPTYIGNNDATSSEFSPLSEGTIAEAEEHETTAKRKNEKTGIVEDEKVDWNGLRKTYTKEGSRDRMHMDYVDWNAVRVAGEEVFATTIRKRGQFRILAGRILKFLNNEATQNGTVDLEWLRDAPSDLVKRYLLEIEGVGLKSTECVRLLGLNHSAFPVDTNVGRIAVRLGWVPLEPLPDGVQMHQLHQYPSMDLIQKYLWPRLCKLPQETLYELHYQMITFGKVFCTKAFPNCNACPMKSECKYFASAYVSSKDLLQGPKEKTQEDESDAFMPTHPHDVDSNMTLTIPSIEECASPEYNDETNDYEPMVEFPYSPRAEIPELEDIEDTPCRSHCQSYAGIPKIDIDMDTLKKNVVDALLKGGKMLNNCDEEVSKALTVLTPENACIPIKAPRKMKYYNRLRTEHVVYVLPDNHDLLHDFERRELDDPSPYLLAIWQPGETSYSFTPPEKKCNSDGAKLCEMKTCSYCWTIREQSSNTFRGTILIPCRTAMRGGFPLNGTYFQTNEVFADHETSLKPIVFPRDWCEGLEKRALYCGSSVTSICRFLDTRRIQLCFWTGFLCMRAFDRNDRNPKDLVRRLHTPPAKTGKNHMEEEE